MIKSFQKTANSLQELQLSHPGIIDADDFAAYFDLHCYAPSSLLLPFLEHIWVQRLKQLPGPDYTPPVELISGPNIYLFFAEESAFIHGVARRVFEYEPHQSAVIAGVKFQPGGFYPFLGCPVSELDLITPASTVFAKADSSFAAHLLTQTDEGIVHMIERLLCDVRPKTDKNLRLVKEIADVIAADSSLQTVSAVAQMFAMSERSLQHVFQTYAGVGVKWIITRRRLLEAIDRVRSQPHLTWAEVAAELGYSSQSHFSRDFKDVTGASPSVYLKRLHV